MGGPGRGRAVVPDAVVCFGGVDWWYHTRGHSECQLMRRLAARTKVVWVNSIGMRVPRPGATRRPVHRWVRKAKSTVRGLRRDASGMWVYSPVFVPWYSEAGARVNGRLLAAQVRALGRVIGFGAPSAFVTVPTAAYAALGRGYARVVFNRADDYGSFPEADQRFIRGLERELLTGADVTAYASGALLEREVGVARRGELLGHGVDFAHFAREREAFADHPGAAVLRGSGRPIIGFYGGLESYTVDLELMVKTARAFGHATVAVIGPRSVSTAALEREANVVCLGHVAYEELPAYAAQFDVGIMPWLDNKWIAACNPIKLKEYLALGFPIASTAFPALAPYEHLVHVGRTHEGFLDAVGRALAERDPARRAARRDAVRHDSWEALAGRVGALLGLASDEAPARGTGVSGMIEPTGASRFVRIEHG